MKKLILTIAIILTGLTAFSQSGPRPKQVIKVLRVFACYDRYATAQQLKTTDSLKALGFTPLDVYRIAGTRNMKVTFIKIIK